MCEICRCNEGYELPALRIHWHRIEVKHSRAFDQVDNRGQHRLLLDAAGGVREAIAEKRETMGDRLAKMEELLGDKIIEQWIIWCHLNKEQTAIENILKKKGVSFSSIFGSLDVDESERRLYEWKDKKTTVLLGKPVMLGSGVNLQQCHQAVFVGIDYKFENFIQAIHRIYRFGQHRPVDIHIIFAESEDQVVEVLKRKWKQHDVLVEKMRKFIRKHKLATTAIQSDLSRSIGIFRMENKQKLFTAVNNDCVLEMENIPADTIDLIHTSIPFGNHYSYTAKYEDFGHNPSDGDFWDQMDFLVPDLFRILKPGRVAAIHVKDRILYGHQTKSGFMEVEEFSDDCVKSFRKHGFLYEGRRTIVTDVVRENASTYRLGWSEMARDASKMGSGLPEYLLLFRKPPTSNDTSRADEPVTKDKADYTRARWQLDAHSFWRSNGNGPLTPAELYDYEAHVEHVEQLDRKGGLSASFFMEPPKSMSEHVWDDIVYMRTLNSEQAKGRLENHICPLPFDIVERTIRLYSNEGDLVLDPFAGLFTVVVKAMELGRIGYGIELNEEYYAAGLKYCQAAEQAKLMPSLFDYLETMQAAEAEKAAS